MLFSFLCPFSYYTDDRKAKCRYLQEDWELQSLEQSLSTWGDDFVRLDKNDDDLKDKDLKSLLGLDFFGDAELIETL